MGGGGFVGVCVFVCTGMYVHGCMCVGKYNQSSSIFPPSLYRQTQCFHHIQSYTITQSKTKILCKRN